jgi:hypothetical protein
VDLRVAVPEPEISAGVLEPALETVTRLNERLMSEGKAPTFTDLVKAGKVKWKPEPPGAERFDHAGTVAARGWGDCDDLAPMKAAELRVTGEDPDATARVYKSGPGRWHAVVQRGDGSIDDPSLDAGMRKHKGILGVAPAVVAPMFPASVVGDDQAYRPSLALRPNYRIGAWEARSDVPWVDTDMAMSALSRAKTARTALTGSIIGAIMLGDSAGFADDEHLDRLRAIVGLLSGALDGQDVAACFGEETLCGIVPTLGALAPQVGFDFGKFIKSVAPIVSTGLSFVPGIGPIAAGALNKVTDIIKTGANIPLKIPGVSMSQASNAAQASQASVHPSGLITDEHAPTFRPMPKDFRGYIQVPGGPAILRF